MKYFPIDNHLFITNRKALAAKIQKGALAIFNANDIMPTNADGSMPFRQNSDLFWLSGVDQEESVLLIFPNHPDESMREVLFLKETNKEIAIWEGAKLTKEEAFNTSGIKTVFWLSELENRLDELIKKADAIYLNKNMHGRSKSEIQTRDDRFRLMIWENQQYTFLLIYST
jgi:Xaa-Pro aminopeptidase